MIVRYFAWVRQKTGMSSEEVSPPSEVQTVADMIAWLKSRGPEYEAAFANSHVIRAAIDQTHRPHDAKIAGASEIAFFPPITGG